MRLPFVSRDEYDAQVERANRLAGTVNALTMHNESLARIIEVDGERYQALLDRALPAPSSPVMATPVREPRTPSVIQEAIRVEAAGDSRLAAFLRKRANELKAEHSDWSDQQIAEELCKWQTTAADGQT